MVALLKIAQWSGLVGDDFWYPSMRSPPNLTAAQRFPTEQAPTVFGAIGSWIKMSYQAKDQPTMSQPPSVPSEALTVRTRALLATTTFAHIDPDRCTGCGECLSTCPYESIGSMLCDERTVAIVDAASCKGCGGCVPACPVDAIDLLGYTDAQMLAAIGNLVKEPVA